ncbi:hypothetical protein UCRNP2_4960 [Neofusicoccum parvum UCRNP2]|uniref:Uncharacterized protein n=1 Tax=Botryosphaeria parva (strain UCR-NP2) TaxID=1287680 RepID=R1EKG7_BOTPV|nr:hypothetical protein UCRNP2_4960 [Neofusicoccum parvum UCRNP2]
MINMATEVTNIFVQSLSPFSRAYPPALADIQHPITQAEFIAFIDGLNSAYVSNTFSQLGWLLTYIPIVIPVLVVQIIGGACHVLCSMSSFVVTMIRTKLYVKRANRDLFAPRGLKCEILPTKKMMKAIGAFDTENNGKLKLPGLNELDELEYYNGSTEMTTVAEDPQERRVRAVQGLVMPLSWDAGRDPMVRGFLRGHMRAMNNRSVNNTIKRRAKALQNVTQETTALAAELATVNQEIAAMETQGHAPDGADRNFAAKLEKRSQIIEEIKLVGEREMAAVDKKEEKVANKIMWIVVTRVEQGGCVEELQA